MEDVLEQREEVKEEERLETKRNELRLKVSI